MKTHDVIVAIRAAHSDLEICHLLKVAQSFVDNICKDLAIEERSV